MKFLLLDQFILLKIRLVTNVLAITIHQTVAINDPAGETSPWLNNRSWSSMRLVP